MNIDPLQKLNILLRNSFNHKRQQQNIKSKQKPYPIDKPFHQQINKYTEDHSIFSYKYIHTERSVSCEKNSQRKLHKKYLLNLFNSNVNRNRSLYFQRGRQATFNKRSLQHSQRPSLSKIKDHTNSKRHNVICKTSIEQNSSYNFGTQNGLEKFLHQNLNNRSLLEYKQPSNFNDVHGVTLDRCVLNQDQYTVDVKQSKNSVNVTLCNKSNQRSLTKLHIMQNKQNYRFRDYNQIGKRIKILKNVKDIAFMNKKIQKKIRKVTQEQWEYIQNVSRKAVQFFRPENKIYQNIQQLITKNNGLSQEREIQQNLLNYVKSTKVQEQTTNTINIMSEQPEANHNHINPHANNPAKQPKSSINRNLLLKIKKIVEQVIDPIGNLLTMLIPSCKKYQIKSGIAIYFICRQYLYLRIIIQKHINQYFNNEDFLSQLHNNELIKWLQSIHSDNLDIKVTFQQMIKTISDKKSVSFNRQYLQNIADNSTQKELFKCIKQEKQIFISKNVIIFYKILGEFNRNAEAGWKLYQLMFSYGYSMLNVIRLAEILPGIIEQNILTKSNSNINNLIQELQLFQVKYRALNKEDFKKIIRNSSKKAELDKQFSQLMQKIQNIQKS